jgi:hypothetical protein
MFVKEALEKLEGVSDGIRLSPGMNVGEWRKMLKHLNPTLQFKDIFHYSYWEAYEDKIEKLFSDSLAKDC